MSSSNQAPPQETPQAPFPGGPGDAQATPASASPTEHENGTLTLGQYARRWWERVRGGEVGILPVIGGLVLITIVFQIISPHHVFLAPANLVNLFQQSAVFMVLAMAEGFVLLLGEIDLSVGYVGAVGAVVTVQLVQPATTRWPWFLAILAGIAAGAFIGLLQGTLITRIGLPSFVVTLAGFLIFNGVMLILLLLGPFSGYPSLSSSTNPNPQFVYALMWGALDPIVSWVVMLVAVAALGAVMWFSDSRRRRSGLVAPPVVITVLKIAVLAAVGIAVVAICDINRANLGVLEGVPWVIVIVLAMLGAWTVLMERTRFGRAIYAIGGNPESARRAGIDLATVRTIAFILCSGTAAIGGMLYASYLGGMSNNVNGGQLVLYAIAAAVIGGTSLFGGRGRMMHGVLGGLVIGAIYNGMYLLSLAAQWQ
ncbi:MAG: ABC transporter permease, partial [Candidatus Dormibacteraeota bacterium]|nr:ABC transporter permease [Candidatus Dormibacteraeota bacterium]